MDDTIWKPIEGFDGYWVSLDYRIFSFKSNKVLFTWINNHGTRCVKLIIGTKQYTRSVDKLVLTTFGEKDEHNMPKMRKAVPSKRAGSTSPQSGRDAVGADSSSRPVHSGSAFGLSEGRDKEVTFLRIPDTDENPWTTQWYMCGTCAHAIKLRDVEDHAREVHGAGSAKLYSTGEEWQADNAG